MALIATCRMQFIKLLPLIAVLLVASVQMAAQATFDLVLHAGRAMDPESGLNAVRDVGINDGKIAAISDTPLKGRTVLDASGLVISPGFIDLHSHGQDDENYRYKAMDGVTTALELEVGTPDVDSWYAHHAGKALINFGVSVGHIPIRMQLLGDSGGFDPDVGQIVPHDKAANNVATIPQIATMRQAVQHGLQRGALGVGLGIQYTPAASHEEILEMFSAAAQYHAPVFVHIRGMGSAEPIGGLSSLQEVVADSVATGTPVHVVHITSMGLAATPLLLGVVHGARQNGLDVTAECYPYTAAMTDLGSAIFAPGWQKIMGISYHDLQWVATGERLTDATFSKYRGQGGLVVIHSIPETAARSAVADPLTMIASDGLIVNGKGHPRGAGTFARVLAHYVREEHALSLMNALRKMSFMPAQRLERLDPAMKLKGRLQVGADADVVVFDPARVADQATFEQPAQYSMGFVHVLVNGIPVVRDGKLINEGRPGKPVRAPIQPAQ